MALKLVVPLDMSPTAERALPLARQLSKQLSAEVVLISVIEISSDLDDFISMKEFNDDVVRLERDIEAYLSTVEDMFTGMSVDKVIRVGTAVDEIAALADSFYNAALVLASHGRSGIRRHLIGSVAMRLIHEVRCPAFVVTATAGEDTLPGTVERVLLPLDGSELAETALPMVTGLFDKSSIDIRIVRVSELGSWRSMPYATLDYYGDDRYYQVAQQRVDQYLSGFVAQMRSSGHQASAEIRAGAVSEEIQKAAVESQSDIIAMATHGRTGIDRLIMGSEAERVLRDSPVPVLLQRPTMVRSRQA